MANRPMAERIVVSLLLRATSGHRSSATSGRAPAIAGAPESYLRRALAAKKRAEALGALLTAWGADSFAFDFGAEEVEEAIDLALATFDDKSLGEPRFGAGVAFGELTRIGAGASTSMLGWGEALLTAARLARSAEPGEVLIDERCPPHLHQALRTHGERRFESHEATALVLDTAQPFRRDTLVDALGGDEGAKVRVTVPPLPPILGLPRELIDRVPHAPSIVRTRLGSEPPPTTRGPLSGAAELEGGDAPDSTTSPDSAPGAPISEPASGPRGPHTPPAPSAVVAIAAGRPAPLSSSGAPTAPTSSASIAASSRSPSAATSSTGALPPARYPAVRTAPSVPPPSLAQAGKPSSVPPLSASRISWPGTSDEYTELAAAARQALLKGNVSELERLSDELKSHGEHGDLADRMAGFVAWNRGAKAEGLRKLRAAADAETRPAHRVRALLAYGVALAASGRTDAALLAALGAIARAREVSDRQGEHVCARFLARLSAAAGYERAARTWAEIADEVSAPRPA